MRIIEQVMGRENEWGRREGFQWRGWGKRKKDEEDEEEEEEEEEEDSMATDSTMYRLTLNVNFKSELWGLW